MSANITVQNGQAQAPTMRVSQSNPAFTSAALSSEDVFADVSYLMRNFMPESVPTQMLGITTAGNLFQGAWATHLAYSRFNKASCAQDAGGKVESAIDGCRGVVQSLGGATYAVYRGTRIACEIGRVEPSLHSTTLLGQTTFIAGQVGNALFSVFYLCIAAWSSYSLYHDCSFRSSCKEAQRLGEQRALTFLQLTPAGALSRAASDNSVALVEKTFRNGLQERLQSDIPVVQAAAKKEIVALTDKISLENTGKIRLHIAILSFALLGVAVLALSFCPLAPVVVIALTVVLCLIMLGVDLYFLQQGITQGPPGKYDKLYLIVMGSILILAFAASMALTVGFGLALAPLVVEGVATMLGLAKIGHSYYQIDQKEKKWQATHTHLLDLQERLTALADQMDTALDTRIESCFKHLPKEERDLVRKGYFDLRTQLPFQYPLYYVWSQGHSYGDHKDFVGRCLYSVARLREGIESVQAADRVILKAIKKSVKASWALYGENNTPENKTKALEIQKMFELNKLGEFKQTYTQFLSLSPASRDLLEENIWYVAKKQESRKDLLRVINSIITK